MLACPRETERHEDVTNKTAYRGSKWLGGGGRRNDKHRGTNESKRNEMRTTGRFVLSK